MYNDFLGSDEKGSDSFIHPPTENQRKNELNDMKAYIPAFPLPVVCVEQCFHRQDHAYSFKVCSFSTWTLFSLCTRDFISSSVNNTHYYGTQVSRLGYV